MWTKNLKIEEVAMVLYGVNEVEEEEEKLLERLLARRQKSWGQSWWNFYIFYLWKNFCMVQNRFNMIPDRNIKGMNSAVSLSLHENRQLSHSFLCLGLVKVWNIRVHLHLTNIHRHSALTTHRYSWYGSSSYSMGNKNSIASGPHN